MKDELHYLDNYINFQQFSYEKHWNVVFEKNIDNETLTLSPMLFQPFIENAFKYSGIGLDDDAFIKISLNIENGNVYFNVENSKKRKNNKENLKDRDGVVLINVKKRLIFLYPNKY